MFAASFLRGSISLRWAQHKRRHKSITLITWSKFKAFLQKDLESSQAFIDSIWSKFRRDSQYQLEEVRDWASHLQHLQSILSEFDRTPDELTMICYFREGLKPSIKVEMEQQDRESMDFEEMVQRAVNAEAKAGLRSSSMVRDSDIRCSRGHRPSNSTAAKVQTQGTKDSHPEEQKVKETRPAPSRAKASEPSEQARKEKKKKRHQERRDKNQTPNSTANATEVQQKKKKKNQDRDISKVTCFNCNKKGHYASICTKPPKTSVGFGNIHAID